ncbi:DUF411 domain-containing protein [Roseospira marina]|uniref:DUF411 domain-containing protein n=1 Tax=Roseospira marina TaxID=140057 RepID=A0A5M6IEL1_9PROT|nr:DUF411 domain-containing protein [Roseospira marina]KAA5606199.1 DUF411 domain-containing protein [Roseospira marina]MBB4314346.1 hypothetical protein [Roseospira marina]MBB5087506.1 hypothetical protein [Roseospira marina]
MLRFSVRSLVAGALLVGAPVAVAAASASEPAMPRAAASASEASVITVYKAPTCGCCGAWGEHLRAHGFTVIEKDTEALYKVKALAGVPDDLVSCHTATVDGYVIEGHVPATDIQRLLAEAPAATGLAVPGMPPAAPGMDVPGHDSPYAVLLFDGPDQPTVYATH